MNNNVNNPNRPVQGQRSAQQEQRPGLVRMQGGRQYATVNARVSWFREANPRWSILTECIELNREEKFAVYRATIRDESGNLIQTATKEATGRDHPDYIEKAETGAIGRALGFSGYGTEDFINDTNEDGTPFVTDRPHGDGQDTRKVSDARRASVESPAGEATAQKLPALRPPSKPDDSELYAQKCHEVTSLARTCGVKFDAPNDIDGAWVIVNRAFPKRDRDAKPTIGDLGAVINMLNNRIRGMKLEAEQKAAAKLALEKAEAERLAAEQSASVEPDIDELDEPVDLDVEL